MHHSAPQTSPATTVRVGIGHQRKGRWLLRPGAGCALGRTGGTLLRLHDARHDAAHDAGPDGGGRRACCKLTHTGRSMLVEKQDPDVVLSVGPARVDKAELPLDGRFRVAGHLVSFQQVRADDEVELLPGMIGAAASMQQLARLARRVARFEVPALVLGESGTGKELVARALHQLGPRADKPFVVVNAAELSEQLGGSALFGHVRGAYTGADRPRDGAFRRADGGTLFLDEVAELTPALQAQLLRVVEHGRVAAVGDDEARPVDVRLVAATCKPLRELVAERRFRLDLYQRLAVHTLHVPPLRNRRGDMTLIARRLMGEPPWVGYRLSDDALAPLSDHPLDGNVRELRNLLAQAVLFCDDQQLIDADAVCRAMQHGQPARRRVHGDQLAALLRRCDGNVAEAARAAGVPRSTFRDRLRKAQLLPSPAVMGAARLAAGVV